MSCVVYVVFRMMERVQIVNIPEISVLLCWGQVVHNFHLHCILKWLEQETSKGLCPMCRQIFTFKEQKKQTPEEVAKLKKLIDGHKVMRERPEQADQEFEEYVPETIG